MKTFAIGSGKGGVGKSSLTANLAVVLANQGYRVVAMDADFGLANLDIMMGLSGGATLRDLVGGFAQVEDVLRTHPSGARVLAGCSGVAELADLDPRHLGNILGQLSKLEESTDYLLVDVAAGVHNTAITTLGSADEALIVMTADPSSFLDAYATIKRVHAYNPSVKMRGIVNGVSDESSGKLLFARLQSVARDHIEDSIAYGGSLSWDEAMSNSVRARQTVVERAPNSAVAEDIERLAASLANIRVRSEGSRVGFFNRLLQFGNRALRAA
ncbi:MinD/ParA family protein [bacterium]|nr:MAG: MinD/ParA family protein [bacterium]